jgi:outer membrane protein TolC
MSPVDAGYRHGKRRAGRPAALLTALLVAGCAVGPDFHTPAALALDRYTEGETPSATVAAATRGGAQQRLDLGRDIAGDWWTLFRSPRLTALVEQALRANPDLAAQATLREAEEDLRAGEGSLLPTITASGSTTREEDSPYSYGSAFSTGGKPKPLDRFTVYQGTFNLSYTIDLFGGIRR